MKCFIAIVFILCTSIGIKAEKNVLYISSYNIGNLWSDRQLHGTQEAFSGTAGINLFVEFLDKKRLLDGIDDARFLQFIETKYKDIKFDGLIVADNDAFDFVLSYRSRPFFYNLPLVFTGIGNIEDYEIDLFRQHIFGVIESNGYPAILRSIKQLFPGHRKVYVMLDKSNTNQVYKNDILKNKTKFEPLELVFTDNLNEKELFDTIANADLNSVLYFVNISRFNDTTLVDPVELCSKIVAKTILPVFTGYDIHSVKEALGGSYNNGITAGTLGGKIMLDLLDGKNPDQPLLFPEVEMVFNYKPMMRFGIKKADLPPNSSIQGEPVSFVQANKQLLISSLLIISLLVIVIAILVANIRAQRKIKRKYLIAKQQAEASDRLKSAFLANMSHEFRTPLNAIVGFSEIVKDENKDTELNYYLDIVSRNAETLTVLINDVLDISLLDANQLKLVFRPFNIGALLNEIYLQFQRSIKGSQKSIELIFNYPNNPETIFSDEVRLKQIITNLVNNAIKYTKEGRIEFGFEVKNTQELPSGIIYQLGAYNVGKYLLFYFHDTGIGIPDDKKHEIFERFTQIDTEYVKLQGGAGLGLSICKSLVTLLGGAIWLESSVNIGTSFYFCIPYTDVNL